MTIIVTKSNKKTKAFPEGREIELNTPKVLDAETLSELVTIQGEDLCASQIKSQLTIAYRSMIRTKLDAFDDNDDPKYTDDQIKAMDADFTDWKPEPRTRKTAEEKALEALGALPPEQRAAVLAALKAQGKK